jgi:hypothetical protein
VVTEIKEMRPYVVQDASAYKTLFFTVAPLKIGAYAIPGLMTQTNVIGLANGALSNMALEFLHAI